MATIEELQQILMQANKTAAPKPAAKPKPVVVAAPAVETKTVENVVTVIRESESFFLQEVWEEVRYAEGEERVKVLKGICERISKITQRGLKCEVRPNKANGKAVVPFPDHGLRANAERIHRALNLGSLGTTVESLVAAVELSEGPTAGAVQ
jgi:hypothetical protein